MGIPLEVLLQAKNGHIVRGERFSIPGTDQITCFSCSNSDCNSAIRSWIRSILRKVASLVFGAPPSAFLPSRRLFLSPGAELFDAFPFPAFIQLLIVSGLTENFLEAALSPPRPCF